MKIAIFGAGIAGLSAAHELVRRGYQVTVYEANGDAGGFFRSGSDNGMPTEYSWHGFGPWYRNTFDLLKQIPANGQETKSLYDTILSRPIHFGMVPSDNDGWESGYSVKTAFRFTRLDKLLHGYLLAKTFTSRRRSEEEYARLNASEAFRPLLSNLGWRTWRACFGPWVGSDWAKVSLHQVGVFFRKQLFAGPAHAHVDDHGAWEHGSRMGWLVLRGPSSEVWFDAWVSDLKRQGVTFHFNARLGAFRGRIDGCTADNPLGTATLSGAKIDGRQITADWFILATGPFAARDILARTPGLAAFPELRNFEPLVADGPHVQVSFRLAFSEPIAWPGERRAVVLSDSPYNITLFAQEQAWGDTDLGEGIRALWTGTACVDSAPGRLTGKTLRQCTRAEFEAEVLAQIVESPALRSMLRSAWEQGPAPFKLDGFKHLVRFEVWHEWEFGPDGLKDPCPPKWVNTTRTQPWLPDQRVSGIPNLLLAGAHTKTDADVWSIEAAVESGRRAARAIAPDVTVIPAHVPGWLLALQRVDDALYAVRAPHLIDTLLFAVMALLGGVALWLLAS